MRRFVRDSATVAAGAAFAGFVAYVREVLVARRLGLGLELDLLVLALAVLALVGSSIVSGLDAAVVPAHVRAREESDGKQFAASSVVIFVGLGILVGAVFWVAAPAIAVALGSTSSSALVPILRLFASVALVARIARGVAASLLHAHRRFLSAAASPCLAAGIVIVGVTFSARDELIDIARLYTVGFLVEGAALLTVAACTGVFLRPQLTGVRAAWKQLRLPFASAAAGALIFGVNPLVDLWFARRVEDGGAGQLALAGRLPLAVAALAASAIATPLFPRFASAHTEGGSDALAQSVGRALKGSLVLVSVAALALAALGFPLAQLLFEGGEISTAQALSVAKLQIAMSALVVPYVGGVICVRALHASGRSTLVLATACGGAALNVALDGLASSIFGLAGIAIVTAVVYCFTFAAMYAALRRGRAGQPSAAGTS